MVSESKQEERIRQYFLNSQIGFEQHKRILGYGGKTWIVDFYLPEYSIVIEAKMVNFLKKREWGVSTLGGIYKDLYKLDELIRKYDLIGVLILEANNYKFKKRFIANINAHRIFFIWEISQIRPILQISSIDAFNKIPPKELIETIQPIPPESAPLPKKEKTVTFGDRDMQALFDWTHGKTAKELGLHAMQINRLVRKFIRVTLEETVLEQHGKIPTKLMEFEKHGEAKL